MTQLDFFDTQEDQERAWAEKTRQREAMQLAQAMGLTATLAEAGARLGGGKAVAEEDQQQEQGV